MNSFTFIINYKIQFHPVTFKALLKFRYAFTNAFSCAIGCMF